ncbi:MAG: SMI1/KNR4 family protein [Eggerthellaceae bacterium]|nr:SMI1/KNR4 family protein [Eggerthellaceae bacterium]
MDAKPLELVTEKLGNAGKTNLLDGATEAQISEFEKENKLGLPLQYREWLLLADGGEFFLPAGVQLYGVAHSPMIDATDNNRPSSEYIVIGALASGDPVLCMQTSEQISIFNKDAGRIESDEVYSDFLSFLNGLPELLGIEG